MRGRTMRVGPARSMAGSGNDQVETSGRELTWTVYIYTALGIYLKYDVQPCGCTARTARPPESMYGNTAHTVHSTHCGGGVTTNMIG